MAVSIDHDLLKSFLVPCGVSILCQVSVMTAFLLRKHYSNYAFQLISYLILANLILSVGFFLSLDKLTNNYRQEPDDSALCIVQSILINFGQLATSIWTSLISYILMRSFQTSEVRTPHQLLLFVSLGFGVPLLMTILPFALQQNGDNGYYCWLTPKGTTVLALFEFTIPTLLCIIYDLVAITRAIILLRQLQEKTEGVRRLLLYPLITFLCWVLRFASRLEYALKGEVDAWLSWGGLLTIGIQGTVSSFVYASNMQLIKCCSCQKKEAEASDQPSKEMELVSMDSKKEYQSSESTNENRGRCASNPNKPENPQRYRSYSHYDER